MVEVDTMELVELLLRYVALPCLLGIFFCVGLLVWDGRSRSKRQAFQDRQIQLEGANKAYTEVISAAERVLVSMRYHAWNVAWRKVRPEGLFSEDLVEEDERKWRDYDTVLSEWRTRKIQFRHLTDQYFGKREAASRLFRLIDASIDKLSFELWFIYHENPNNPNVFMEHFVEEIDEPYDSVFNAIMTSLDKEITREQESSVHEVASNTFDELQDKINRLAFEMTESIQKGNVGTLRRARPNVSGRRSARKSRTA